MDLYFDKGGRAGRMVRAGVHCLARHTAREKEEYTVAVTAIAVASTVAVIVVVGDAEDVPSSMLESCRKLARGCWRTVNSLGVKRG